MNVEATYIQQLNDLSAATFDICQKVENDRLFDLISLFIQTKDKETFNQIKQVYLIFNYLLVLSQNEFLAMITEICNNALVSGELKQREISLNYYMPKY